MNITKEQLEKIREKLPNGAQSKIAETVGMSHQYVNMVLNGKVDVTDSNKKIIAEAINVINANKAENEKLMSQLENI